jgi:hypothetical protein
VRHLKKSARLITRDAKLSDSYGLIRAAAGKAMFRALIFASVFGSRKEARGPGEGLQLVVARFGVKQVELLSLIIGNMLFWCEQ